MWNKKFVYILDYLKKFKAVPKNNPLTTTTTTKSPADDGCLFQSLYSCNVAKTIIGLRSPSFTKKGVSSIKQKNVSTPLNSAYSNHSKYQISA